MRKFLTSVHRWLGLTLGLVLALICLSGAALLFQPQFFRWAHGDLIPPQMSQQIGSIDTWVKNANAAVPELGAPLYIYAPQTSHNISDAGMLLYRDEPSGFGKLGLTAVLIAPASGEVLGVVNVDRSPAYAPIFLHGRLWSGGTGLTIAASIAVGAALMLIIGLYLWWPPRKWLVKKLSVRPWRNTFLYAGRLHDWSGVWSLLLLLMVSITGVYMARDEWLDPMLQLLPGESHHSAHVSTGTCDAPIGFDQAVERGKGLAAGAAMVEMRATSFGDMRHWMLSLQPAGTSAGTQQTHIAADLQCGTLAVVGSPDERAPRDTAELMLHGLHDGTQFGLFGQIIISLVGLIPLLLAWTGVVRWLRTRQFSKAAARTAAAGVGTNRTAGLQ